MPSASVASVRQPLKIRIISASGLRDADNMPMQGTSDPYCICKISNRSQSPELKTDVKQDTVNPEWNYEGLLDDYVLGENLEFEVWDKDIGNFDDLLGKATLLSNEIHDGACPEMRLRESTHKGGTDGANAVLRVEVWFKKVQPLTVRIISASGLRDADTMPTQGTSDPYCICKISNRKQSPELKTVVMEDTVNPEWNYEGLLDDYVLGENLEFEVWDKDSMNYDDLLGKATLLSNKIRDGADITITLTESTYNGGTDGTHAALRVAVRLGCSPLGQGSHPGAALRQQRILKRFLPQWAKDLHGLPEELQNIILQREARKRGCGVRMPWKEEGEWEAAFVCMEHAFDLRMKGRQKEERSLENAAKKYWEAARSVKSLGHDDTALTNRARDCLLTAAQRRDTMAEVSTARAKAWSKSMPAKAVQKYAEAALQFDDAARLYQKIVDMESVENIRVMALDAHASAARLALKAHEWAAQLIQEETCELQYEFDRTQAPWMKKIFAKDRLAPKYQAAAILYQKAKDYERAQSMFKAKEEVLADAEDAF